MSGLIDWHTHALPAIDDGAKDEAESLALLEMSYAQGVTLTALTPHCTLHREGSLERFLSRRQAAYERLLKAKEQADRPMPQLLLGAELYADHDISRVPNIERLCLEGTRFLLMELAFADKLEWLSECVYMLNRQGIVPMIAHVERYPQRDRIFADLKDLKVIYQLNASCFLSFMGRMRAKQILRHGETFIVASDMHNLNNRPCDLDQAYRICQKRDPELAQILFLREIGALTQTK